MPLVTFVAFLEFAPSNSQRMCSSEIVYTRGFCWSITCTVEPLNFGQCRTMLIYLQQRGVLFIETAPDLWWLFPVAAYHGFESLSCTSTPWVRRGLEVSWDCLLSEGYLYWFVHWGVTSESVIWNREVSTILQDGWSKVSERNRPRQSASGD